MARQLTLPPVRRARLADLPSAITQTHPGNRVFRATFWRKEGLAFSEAGSKVNRDPIVEAYLRARAFDVVDEVTYRSMNRGLGTPIGHQHDSMAELPEWLDRQRETMELLRDADDEVRTAWVVGVLERDVARFCEDAERADEGRWADLRAHARSLVEFGGDGVSGRLSSDTSVRTWLLLHDKRTSLEQLSLLRRFTNGHRRTEVHDGRVYAMLPFHGADEPGVPDELYEMSAHETRLSTELWGCRWTEDQDLELTLFTYINFVDYQGVVPDVSVSLVEEHGGEALDLTVSHFDHVFANASVAHRFQDYRPGGCRVTVPVTVLARHARRLREEGVEAPSWRLSVQVTARGLTRSGTISVVEPRGTAGGLGTAWLAPVAVEGLEVVAEPDPLTGLRISIADLPAVNLGSASVSGRVLTGRVESDLPVSGVVAWRPDGAPRVEAPVKDGSFVLDVPDVDYREGRTEARHWRLRALTGDGEHPIGWPLGSSERWYAASPDGQVALSRSTRGNCEIAETTRTMLLHDVRLHEKHLTVRGTWLGAVPDTWRLVLRGPRADLPADVALAADGEVNATIATDWDEWGVGSRPLPTGTYRLVVLSGGPEPEIESVPVLADRLWERLLEEQVSNDHRLRLVKPAREPRLVFEAPLPDDQRGAFAQTRLREAHGPDADLKSTRARSTCSPTRAAPRRTVSSRSPRSSSERVRTSGCTGGWWTGRRGCPTG